MVRALATSDADDERQHSPTITHARAIRLWLYAVAALVLAMVLVGGATRLTESGLSITEWKPVMGVLPPLRDSAWQAEFEKYQAIPQYRELNRGMSLDAFKTIYWWEWTHRLLGRADRRRVSVAVSVVPVARLGRRRRCGRGCGSFSGSARCKAPSAGGWSPPASPIASKSRNIGWRRISCSPA